MRLCKYDGVQKIKFPHPNIFTGNKFETILIAVCYHFGVSIDDLKSNKRHRHIVFARHISTFLFRNKLKMTYAEIGRYYNRDHTSSMHSVQEVQSKLTSVAEDPLADAYHQLTKKIPF